MSYINISDEAYVEFKDFLEFNKVENYNLRIAYLGRRCSGPIFNIATCSENTNDIVEQIKEISFIMNKELIDEYGGFEILSSNENQGEGLILKPMIAPVNNCNICPGC
jgi:HesB-like selenoprotein